MAIEFKHHDLLRLFVEIAQCGSFSEAADSLHLTKGAISYQIKTLEGSLGCSLFQRKPRGVSLTNEGAYLFSRCQGQYRDIESALLEIRGLASQSLTVGVSSYFAARWLSPRLMSFMQSHPDIQLRILPMISITDLSAQGIDVAIRWGDGQWDDAQVEPFLPMPAYPVGNRDAFLQVKFDGIARALEELTLLRDHEHSNAWTDWFSMAALPLQARRDTLIIPDPNVRVQAVIDGQGIALMDDLVSRELADKQLFRLNQNTLSTYGYYLVYPSAAKLSASAQDFIAWLHEV